jgi:recombination protein RecA
MPLASSKARKNKVAPPFKQAEFDVIYGLGISWEGTVLDVGLERKIVTKSGSYFSFGDERLGQGRQNATAFLTENPDLVQSILARVQAEAGADQIVSARLLPQAPATAGDAGATADAVEDVEEVGSEV